MTIANLVRFASAALIAVLLAGGFFAATEINTIRMGGPIQARSQQAADLVADILPPPEYVIEPYLEATLLLSRPDTVGVSEPRLKKLHDDYVTRRDHWQASNLDPKLKDLLLNGSRVHAEQFWTELEDHFLPAVKRGDAASVHASYAALSHAYAAHRAKVDALVAAANDYQAKVASDAAGSLSFTIALLAIAGAAVLAIVATFSIALLRRVVKPLVEVSAVTTRLAAGGNEEVPYRDRRDELGHIAVALEQFRVAAIERAERDAETAAQQRRVTEALGERLTALRDGDLARTIGQPFPQAYETLRTNFNDAVGALREMIQLVSESANSIDTGSKEIAAASEDLALRTESGAATITETRTAIEDIETRLRAGMESANRTVARADEANNAVGRGRDAADRAVRSMDRVNTSAQDIGTVIEGLDKIAFQTRVLSMNATVEAGRAGDAGRGFAVVADLVSALAQRAEAEAKRVRDLITATQADIAGAVASVRHTDEALAEISVEVEGVRELLGGIRDGNAAQASSVAEITTSVVAMDISTQQNAAMVEQTSAAARNLSGEVAALAERAAAFKFERRTRNVPVAFDRRHGGQPALPRAPLPPLPAPDEPHSLH